jgi:hypothetical protein
LYLPTRLVDFVGFYSYLKISLISNCAFQNNREEKGRREKEKKLSDYLQKRNVQASFFSCQKGTDLLLFFVPFLLAPLFRPAGSRASR